ncbi:MAG TPA: tripartite tricarboxylate transporter substrate binding protein [Ideonella sp.]|nr:tripartite tricarboxylate transporter substrate binding protein [Ideonella sp.]
MPYPALTRRQLALCLAALALAGSAAAQTPAWPAKPLRIVLTSTPGAPSDIVMRIAGEKLQASLKQTVVIENKGGAGGNLASADVARAAPDGLTWLWTTDNTLTVNPHVYKTLGFKPEDLTPVSVGSVFSQTLVCNPSLGVKTLAEFVKKAKASKLAYASGGAGVPGHLAMELLASAADIEMEHIPYKGPAPAAQDVLGGQVACGFLAGPTVLPHVRSGRLVALAVSGTHRSPVLPEVPTVAEAGFPGYDASFLLVMMAPKGTPANIVAAMNKALVEALKSPDVVEKLKATDQTVVADTPAQAAARLAGLSKQWGAVARKIQLSLD